MTSLLKYTDAFIFLRLSSSLCFINKWFLKYIFKCYSIFDRIKLKYQCSFTSRKKKLTLQAFTYDNYWAFYYNYKIYWLIHFRLYLYFILSAKSFYQLIPVRLGSINNTWISVKRHSYILILFIHLWPHSLGTVVKHKSPDIYFYYN